MGKKPRQQVPSTNCVLPRRPTPTKSGRLASTTFLLSAVVLIGCGGSDVQRYRASGTVTYQGSPVSQGTIMFEPDTSKGNSGAAGTARILDGQYDTAVDGGKGISGGPQIVSIQGFDGVDPNPEYAPYGSPIGNGKSYIKRFDFPEDQAIEQDFEMADVIDAP